MVTDVTQQECSNNKYYTSTFRYIYIYIYMRKLLSHISKLWPHAEEYEVLSCGTFFEKIIYILVKA